MKETNFLRTINEINNSLYIKKKIDSKTLEVEYRIVEKWQKIGCQFSIGAWCRDYAWQRKILNASDLSFNEMLYFIRVGFQNIIIIIFCFVNILLAKLLIKNKIDNIDQIELCYSVKGLSTRVAMPLDHLDIHRRSYKIIFNSWGGVPYKLYAFISLRSFFYGVYVFLKSAQKVEIKSVSDFLYFFKEVLDFHCLLHFIIVKTIASKYKNIKITMVSEGFSREYCAYLASQGEVNFVNLSPTINIERPNTIYSYFKFGNLLTYKFPAKKYWFENINTKMNKQVSFDRLMQNLICLDKRIVIVEGYSSCSAKVCMELFGFLDQEAGLVVKYKPHPRHSNEAFNVDTDDIVLCCYTSQFALLRSISDINSVNFYYCWGDNAFDPAPYSNILFFKDLV